MMEAASPPVAAASSSPRFGRSRALEILGAALFGVAGRAALRPGSAVAYHKKKAPCGPSGGCHCCRGRSCCESNRTERNGQCPGTNSTQNAWRICHGGHQHWCADYWDRKHRPCICRATYERKCGAYGGTCATGTDGDYVTILTGFVTGKAGEEVHASSTAVFFDCGVGVSDVIPQQETDLVVAAENIVETWDNFVDTTTDPDNLLRNPFQPGGVLCDKYNLCIYSEVAGP